MANKLCCVLNPYVKNRSERICEPCLEDTIKAGLAKNIDWDKEARLIASAQRDYLNDDHGGGWYDLYCENSSSWDKLEKLVRKITGPNADDDVYDNVLDTAEDIFTDLQDKAMNRVKIVVK